MMKPIDLTEHPEGGQFREVFRSAETVTTAKGNIRSALTHIYFSLNPGERSRFHRVESDEVWNLYQGAGVCLYTWDGSNASPECIILSSAGNTFCHVVPAGMWQAAEPISDSVLIGCSVAPGFEFSDFTLIDSESEDGKRLVSMAPELARFVISEESPVHPLETTRRVILHVIISRLLMRTYLYLRFVFHKVTRTGTFGKNRADYILTPPGETENHLKNALFRHHVKQFHSSSCSVASVVNVINAILQRKHSLNLIPITQHQILERVKAGHWKERMGENGYNGLKGLPLTVLAQVVKASLGAYEINCKFVEAVQAERRGRRSRFVRETLVSRLKQFETQGDCLIIAHFDQGSFVQDLNIPHISPVGGFDLETGKVTILDVDPSQPHPYQISFDTFYRGISTDYNQMFKPFGFGGGGYIFIHL